VVPAKPEDWKKDIYPFKLTVDPTNSDKLYGRGVTDCLGHVAMLACLLKELAVLKPTLETGLAVVFIACEEDSTLTGIGIDELSKRGELKFLKKAPLFWVDSADFGPTLGTGGMATWELKTIGKGFHSGFPHKAINSINLASEAVKYLQKRFHKDFPKLKKEDDYKFQVGTSMKPTRIESAPGGLNQIPPYCTASGDIRITPFYSTSEIQTKMEGYIQDLPKDVSTFETFGFDSYELKSENLKGMFEFKWLSKPMAGVAVDFESNGYKAVKQALEEVHRFGPFSLTGSLPLVGDMQADGFDIQVIGFGKMEAYHAANEYGLLSDFLLGARVCSRIVEILNNTSFSSAAEEAVFV